MFYPAFVHHDDENSAVGAFFPDVRGCFTAADDFDGIFAMAQEALSLHAEGLEEDGIALPPPSTLEQLRNNPEWTEDFATATLIRVPLLRDGRPRRINISLRPSLIAAIDAAAKERNMTRSAFIASATQQVLG